MKEPKNQKRDGEKLSFAALTKVRPVPFGDVRKYYLAAKVGTVILLALCFHVSMAAIALRTDSCEQLSTSLIIMVLLAAIAVIVGHYMRSLLGYGISAAAAFLLILLLQFGNGGAPVALTSNLFEFGEVFRDGAKSTDFWILLAKVIAVVHLLLSILFIRSTLTVTEAPPIKGMNVQIKSFTDWLDKNNNSLPPGRRASDYWFVAISLILWMVFVAYDPSMGKYDYWSAGLLLAGCICVACRMTLVGSMGLSSSALIRCTMYQWRFGICIPVVAAYLALYVAILYLVLESFRERKQSDNETKHKWFSIFCIVLEWFIVLLYVLLIPVHEFLGAFSGSYMTYQKDNLPLIFFLPLLLLLGVHVRNWKGFLFGAGCSLWLWDSLEHAAPNEELFNFVSYDEHGSVGRLTTDRLMVLVEGISYSSIVIAVVGVCLAGAALYFAWRRRHESKKMD